MADNIDKKIHGHGRTICQDLTMERIMHATVFLSVVNFFFSVCFFFIVVIGLGVGKIIDDRLIDRLSILTELI